MGVACRPDIQVIWRRVIMAQSGAYLASPKLCVEWVDVPLGQGYRGHYFPGTLLLLGILVGLPEFNNLQMIVDPWRKDQLDSSHCLWLYSVWSLCLFVIQNLACHGLFSLWVQKDSYLLTLFFLSLLPTSHLWWKFLLSHFPVPSLKAHYESILASRKIPSILKGKKSNKLILLHLC